MSDLEKLNKAIEKDKDNCELLMERGKLLLSNEHRGEALNDFMRVYKLNGSDEANEYIVMIRSIFDFVNFDSYNP